MGNFFGTDGVRGIANQELSCELAIKIGKSAAQVLTGDCGHQAKILIGKDTRLSSDMLESALLSGICSVGAVGISIGVVPTPAVAYLVKKYNADAGIMISASHNSFEFNGIKLFDKNGYKLPDNIENQIEELILHPEKIKLPEDFSKIGKIVKNENAKDDYIEYIASTSKQIDKNLKIAIDCSNGSASATAEKLFKKLNLNPSILFSNPDGININDNCGSTALENLVKYVKENKCDLGIAFDGDADRCLMVDDLGNIIDGDAIIAICAQSMKSEGKLKNNALVGTIMSNLGLKKFCKQNDINFLETKVGDRYVLERMKQEGYIIGGEQSGHVIFLDYSTTGDGELTAVQFLNVLSKSHKRASELNSLVKKYPQKSTTVNIQRSQKGLLLKNDVIMNFINNKNKELGSSGRLVIRESGTEPKIRIMAELGDESKLEQLLNEAKKVISENI